MTQSYLPSRWLITSPQFANDPDIFPLLPGFSFITSKRPIWSTGIQQATSGRERRRMQWSYPLWQFKVGYEVLRDAPTYAEQQKLLAFFNSHAGRYQEFFFYDPSDNAVVGQQFGTGDGTTTTFQLNRTISGGALSFTEPVRGLAATPTVRVNGAMVGAPLGKNLLQYSEQFQHTPWNTSSCSVSPNTTAAPDGTTTADALTRSGTSACYVFQQVSTSGSVGNTYCFSVWLKAGTYSGPVRVRLQDSLGGWIFDSVVTPSSTWTRYSISGTMGAGADPTINVVIWMDNAGTAGETTLMWGAQLESGPTATAYVPTTSAAGDYTVNPLGQITFTSAPASSAVLTWSGNFMFLVRFDQDEIDTQQMMNGLWSAQGISLIGVKS